MDKFKMIVDKQQKLVAWQVNGDIDVAEAAAYAQQIKQAIQTIGKDTVVFVDNSNMMKNGVELVFKEEAQAVWGELMMWMTQNCSKIAVVSAAMLGKMQIGRMARENKLDHMLKVFYNKGDAQKSYDEAQKHLGVMNVKF